MKNQMFKGLQLFALILLLTISGLAQVPKGSERPFKYTPMYMENTSWVQSVQSVSKDKGVLILQAQLNTGDPVFLQVRPITEYTIRIRANAHGKFEQTPQEKDGFVKSNWPEVDFELEESDSELSIRLKEIALVIQKNPIHLSFLQEGKVLTETAEGPSILFNDEECQLRMKSPDNEVFLGFGSQGSRQITPFNPGGTPFNHRGHDIQMLGLSSNRDYYVPFFQSSMRYGLFLNTLTKSLWDMAKTHASQYVIHVDEPVLDFYVMSGDLKRIVNNYTNIVGRSPMPPKSRLGAEIDETAMLWESPALYANDDALYNTAKKKGYLVNGPGLSKNLVDFTNPAAVNWWKKELSKRIKTGGKSIMLDSDGSGFGENLPESNDTQWFNGMTGRQMENYYGPLHMKLVFETLREGLDGKRAYLDCLHQGYFASSKYPYMAFGDRNTYSNNELRIRTVINNGLSGIAYWDGGGDISFDAIPTLSDSEMNRLSPVTYTYWWLAYKTGFPVLRSMIMEYKDDPECYKADAQYLFGKDILVAPMVRGSGTTREAYPESDQNNEMMEDGKLWRKVYLPEGVWVDFRTKEKYLGPEWRYFQVSEEQVPLLVRGGAVLPRIPEGESPNQKTAKLLELEIFPTGGFSYHTMYEDDGETYAYESGKFTETDFSMDIIKNDIEIVIHPVEGGYDGMLLKRDYVLKVIGTTEPLEILVDGRSIDGWEYLGPQKTNKHGRILTFAIPTVDVKKGAVVSLKGTKLDEIYF